MIDISRHQTNPYGPGEIAPNIMSFFVYPGAAAGIGPVFTGLDHPALPAHVDRFSMTVIRVAAAHALISFDGVHLGAQPPFDDRELVPEPSTWTLLCLGVGLALAPGRLRRVKL